MSVFHPKRTQGAPCSSGQLNQQSPARRTAALAILCLRLAAATRTLHGNNLKNAPPTGRKQIRLQRPPPHRCNASYGGLFYG